MRLNIVQSPNGNVKRHIPVHTYKQVGSGKLFYNRLAGKGIDFSQPSRRLRRLLGSTA